MSIRVTITKSGVTDGYGIAMVVGTTYTVNDDFGLSLISQGKATDTDGSLVNPGVGLGVAPSLVYCNAATIAAPTAAMLANVNAIYALDVAPFGRYRSNGTALVSAAEVQNSNGFLSLVDGSGGVPPTAQPGVRTVLFGDSLTDNYEVVVISTSAVLSGSTLTVTYAGHQQANGWYVCLWNKTYSSFTKFQRLPVTVTSSSVFTVALPTDVAAGLPQGALAGTTFYRAESWRSAEHWLGWLQAISGQRFNIVWNGGQSGDTTAQALDRVTRDLSPYSPQLVFMVMPGINDMSANPTTSEETIYTNQVALIRAVKNTGAYLVLMTPQPVCSPDTRATAQLMSKIRRLKDRVQAYCLGITGVTVVDAFKAIVDPTSATGLANTNYLRTTDGTHYSQRGGKFLADLIWSQIQPYFPGNVQTLPASKQDRYIGSALSLTSVSRASNVVTGTSNAHNRSVGEVLKLSGGSESFNSYVTLTAVTTNTVSFASTGSDGSITGTILLGGDNNIFDNPTFDTATGGTLVAGSGTCTGTAPSLIKVSNVAGTPATVCSVVARPDGYGNDLQLVITPASTSDQVSAQVDFTPSTVTYPALVLAGRTYYFECEVSLIGVAGCGLGEIRCNMSMTIGGTQYQTYALNGYVNGAVINEDVTGLHLRSAPLLMPSGTATIVRPEVLVGFSNWASGATPLVVKIGRVALREVEGA